MSFNSDADGHSVLLLLSSLLAHILSFNRLALCPMYCSVWEQQWVLPHPTARVKVLKWVKTDRTQNFPEEEDARFVYAAATNAAAEAQAAAAAAAAQGVDGAGVSNTGIEQMGEQAATGEDAVMLDASNAAKAAPAVATTSDAAAEGSGNAATEAPALGQTDNLADETQGQHLFDETQADIDMSGTEDLTRPGTTEPPTALGTGAEGTPVPPSTSAPLPASAQGAQAEEGEGEGEEEEAEEEEEQPVHVDKHQTIRIGGPLPDGVPEVPITAPIGEGGDAQGDEAAAASSATQPAAPTEPTPQVESELHPPPDGVPAAPAPAAVTAHQEGAPAAADTIANGGSVVAPSIDVGEGDALGGVDETTRADPEVQEMQEKTKEDVVAVVHDGPGGSENVKVVVD